MLAPVLPWINVPNKLSDHTPSTPAFGLLNAKLFKGRGPPSNYANRFSGARMRKVGVDFALSESRHILLRVETFGRTRIDAWDIFVGQSLDLVLGETIS